MHEFPWIDNSRYLLLMFNLGIHVSKLGRGRVGEPGSWEGQSLWRPPPPQNYPSLLIDAMRERDDSVNVVPPAKVWYQEHGRMSAKAVCSISWLYSDQSEASVRIWGISFPVVDGDWQACRRWEILKRRCAFRNNDLCFPSFMWIMKTMNG